MKKSFSFVGMVCACLLLICLLHSNTYAQSGTKWSVNGNSTVNGDFLGTTNSEPLIFKTDGAVRIKIKPAGDIILKDFDNLGFGFVKFDNDGKLIPVPFNGNIGQVLTGNGSFQSIELISGWKQIGFDLINTNTANVGIGTTTPSEKLSVVGNIYNDGFLLTRGISIIGKAQGQNFTSDTMRTGIMMMDTLSKIEGDTRIVGNASVSDKMGIGTKYPTEALEIVGNSRINGNNSISGTTSSTIVAANDVFISGITKQQLLTTDLTGKITTLTPLGLQTIMYSDQQKQCLPGANPAWVSANGSMYIDLTLCPSVGIGTTTPQSPLDVVGDARVSGSLSAGFFKIANNGNTSMSFYPMAGTRTANNIFTETGSGDLVLQNSSYTSQNLGIGLANGQSPIAKLDVNGSAHISGPLKVGNASIMIDATNIPSAIPGAPENHIYTTAGSGTLFLQSFAGNHQNTLINANNEGSVGIGSLGNAKFSVFSPNIKNEPNTLMARSDGHSIMYVNDVAQGGYNPMAHDGDAGIFWTDGLSTSGTNGYSGLTIAPFGWGQNLAGQNSLGIRITADGKVDAKDFLIDGVSIGTPGGSFAQWLNVSGGINYAGGNVGIGLTLPPANKLEVCGTIKSTKVVVEDQWCDYVFDGNYKLLTLANLEKYIKENHHLPGFKAASEIEANGLDLGKLVSKQMEKIEELTLYILQQQHEIELLKEMVKN